MVESKSDICAQPAAEAALARVAGRVRALSATCPLGFWFITDLHVPSNNGESGALLARLVRETGVGAVVCGGDLPEAFGVDSDIAASVSCFRSLWVDPVEKAGGEFFCVRGNHDLTIRTAPDAETGATWPQHETREVFGATAAMRARAVRDPSSCAFYVDFPGAGTRLVGVDAHEAVVASRPYWGVADGVSAGQMRWLADCALGTLPDGWKAVVASHAPVAGVAAEEREIALFAPLRDLFAPLASSGRLPLWISGHHHGERQSQVAGTWHVTEPCDAAYLDYIHSSLPWVPDLPEKARGTWAGQTFDAVQLDFAGGAIHFTRVGGGADRSLNTEPARLRVGERLRLRTRFIGAPVSWGCHDSDRCERRANPARKYDYFYDYHNDIAEISADGEVRAKAAGEATAVARAADGAREYIPISVA